MRSVMTGFLAAAALAVASAIILNTYFQRSAYTLHTEGVRLER
ncbi:MAG: hypothetical protein RMK64_10315 [Rhodovarius sp.]|nr:hypothetical protein [Rhodovarius sp.]MCS6891819.1 hypothetical protein [Rhodovarius sp.]MCX7931008.1 hypothetical protein [Rhodovarius sp.]MDW8315353.1 hypothetical protein [Rhodovarius sp.]